jgi:outer membrane protein assembly factor BamD
MSKARVSLPGDWVIQLRRFLSVLGFAVLVLVASACSSTNALDNTLGWTPEKLYAEAKGEMSSNNWPAAIKLLEKLESRYPFGRWAQQAQIDLAYAQYKDNERVLALAAVERFLKLHPNHASLDYVYYLKGLINFNEQQGLVANLGGQDLSERDLRAAREAFDAFKEVTTRWPDSKYAADSIARMRYLVNSMARGELLIARYYFRRGAFVAAANRAQSVVRQYRDTPSIEDALYIMYASYDKLGLADLRSDTERVFKLNYPSSDLLARGFDNDDRSWWQLWR